MHILLIEDDLRLLNLFARVLDNAGHTVARAATLHAAQQLVRNQPFDVCVSDMQLGYHSDTHLVQYLVEIQRKGTQVIVVSGLRSMEAVCEEAGLPFYHKPMSGMDLVKVIDALPGAGSPRASGE